MLPISLLGYLEAPMPYIMGLPATYRERPPEGVFIVDLDHNTVTPGDEPPEPLPPNDRRKLEMRLAQYAQGSGAATNPTFSAFPNGRCAPSTAPSPCLALA